MHKACTLRDKEVRRIDDLLDSTIISIVSLCLSEKT